MTDALSIGKFIIVVIATVLLLDLLYGCGDETTVETQDSCEQALADYYTDKSDVMSTAVGRDRSSVDRDLLDSSHIGFCIYRPGFIYHTIVAYEGGVDCGAITLRYVDEKVTKVRIVNKDALTKLMLETIQTDED